MFSSPQMASLMIVLIVVIVQINFGDAIPVSGESCGRWEHLEEVSNCPRNKAEWEEATKRKNCSKLQEMKNCETATYHCLVDSTRMSLVEVCTVPRNLNGHCPLFYQNKFPFVRNDYKRDCSNYSDEDKCAAFYSSTDAYKYQACYNITRQSELGSTLTQQTTTELPSKPASTSVTETELTTEVENTPEVNITLVQGPTEQKSMHTDDTWAFVFLILPVMMIYIICVMYCWKRRSMTWRQALCLGCDVQCNRCKRHTNIDREDTQAHLLQFSNMADQSKSKENNTSSSQPAENNTSSSQPAENNTSSSQPAENNTSSSQPAENNTSSSQPAENNTSSSQPAENNTSSSQPAENNTSSSQPVENITSSSQPAENIALLSENCVSAVDNQSLSQNNGSVVQSNGSVVQNNGSVVQKDSSTSEDQIPNPENNIPHNDIFVAPSSQNDSTSYTQEPKKISPGTQNMVPCLDQQKIGGETLGSMTEVHQGEQNHNQNNTVSNSYPHVCSEDSSDIKGEGVVDVDIAAEDCNTEQPKATSATSASRVTVTKYMKKKKRGRSSTVLIEYGSQQCADKETSDKDIEYLANGLVKGDKRILDLLSVQYELEGRIRYLEIKVSSVNSLICKLEEELSEEVCSLEEMTCKKTIKNRVTYLDSSFGCILKRIEKLEQSFSPSQQGPSAEASGETSKPDDNTVKGACGTDLPKRVKFLEDTLHDIEERIYRFYKETYGKTGQLKVLLAKLEGLECVVDQVEHDHGVPMSTTSKAKEGNTMEMANKAPQRVLQLFERIENLAPYIWK
ncbi:uncharacterized protein LOC125660468 isoform X2 [Ostrea edulis]|uniref:uncharacterized protein LOC125660468 isoform X2 n=1 Tax=Ostrea edulis TaxID=37623 RepID=UPI0024AF5F56|nr:uncharacterized protein LOC125660468 isoform X2 [Ostrea edulis]